MYRVLGELKKLAHMADCAIEFKRSIFKIEMLIYQSKANLDEKLFFKSLNFLIRNFEEYWLGVCMETRIPRAILVRDI